MRKRAAVLGSPIKHSLSPAIHNAAYLALGIEGKYDAVEVPSGQLPTFMNQVKETPAEWIGFSLTMPLKEEIFEVADISDPLALQIKSGNTLLPSADGWFATTTDVSGFIWALTFNEVSDFDSIQIIGAGATARAAAAAVDAPGRKIEVMLRDPKRIDSMKSAVSQSDLTFVEWGSSNKEFDLVINTTPAGAADQLELSGSVLFEALYNPWPTPLVKKWQGKVIGGLDLLIHQAIDQIHLMTDFVIDRKMMEPILRTAANAELADRF